MHRNTGAVPNRDTYPTVSEYIDDYCCDCGVPVYTRQFGRPHGVPLRLCVSNTYCASHHQPIKTEQCLCILFKAAGALARHIRSLAPLLASIRKSHPTSAVALVLHALTQHEQPQQIWKTESIFFLHIIF